MAEKNRFALLDIGDPPPTDEDHPFTPAAGTPPTLPLSMRGGGTLPPSTRSVAPQPTRVVTPPASPVPRVVTPTVVDGIPLWRRIDDNTIDVNLDFPARLPFPGATIAWQPANAGRLGWQRIQRRGSDVFAAGRRVILHTEDEQRRSGGMIGHSLHRALEGKPVLHPNVLDALLENRLLINEGWKRDEHDHIRYIHFWAVGFRGSSGRLYGRYLCWSGGRWDWNCSWLGGGFGGQSPAAVSASS